jgi:hypothetical protein
MEGSAQLCRTFSLVRTPPSAREFAEGLSNYGAEKKSFGSEGSNSFAGFMKLAKELESQVLGLVLSVERTQEHISAPYQKAVTGILVWIAPSATPTEMQKGFRRSTGLD